MLEGSYTVKNKGHSTDMTDSWNIRVGWDIKYRNYDRPYWEDKIWAKLWKRDAKLDLKMVNIWGKYFEQKEQL